MLNILIAEDDANTVKWMKAILQREGYDVLTARNGSEALKIVYSSHVDLIILDIMMPETDGYAFLSEFRKYNESTPVLIVSAKELPSDRCLGLLMGADDYISKPVYEPELILRVKALLRRAHIFTSHRLEIGSVILDYDRLSVSVNGEEQTLPKKEFYLIYKLLSYPDKIFTRIQLMDEIWGMDNESAENTINVHINRLRKRFADCSEFSIIAIRGIGYKAVINRQ